MKRLVTMLGLAASLTGNQSLLQRAMREAPPRTNPFAAQPDAIRAGEKLFVRECSPCHGESGRGNGRNRTPPLATPLVHRANPGALFWILRNGSPSHRMPSFSHLPEPQRWQIITYVQSLH